jgi:hypothetical protein
VAASDLPAEVRTTVSEATDRGVTVVPAAEVVGLAEAAGLTDDESTELSEIYRESQLSSLRVSFVGLIVISLLSILFSRGIPAESMVRRRTGAGEDAPQKT